MSVTHEIGQDTGTPAEPSPAVTTEPESQFVWLDPRQLQPNPLNIRADAEDADEELVASIRKIGVLQPLIVYPLPAEPGTAGAADGGLPMFEILIGHRRRAAALEADVPRVPCIVTASEDAAGQILTMLHENVNRKGLNILEEAGAYRQLELLDWTPQQIADEAARPLTRVQHALTLQGLPGLARSLAARATDDGQMNLDQVAVLAEFADDPKAVQRIASRSGWGVQHAVAEEQTKRRRKATADRFRAELTLAGVKVITRPKNWGYSCPEAEASTLTGSDGVRLDPEEVRTRPGFAAFIDTQSAYQDPEVVIVCLDPEAWGYTRTRRTTYVPDAQRRAEDAERQQAEEEAARLREALATAEGVRHTFLTTTYGNARAAKKVLPDAIRATVQAARVPDEAGVLFTSLAGADLNAAGAAGIDRLTRMLVALWLTEGEHRLQTEITGPAWRSNPAAALAYLDQLTTAGYTLSGAEQILHDRLTASLSNDPDANDEDDVDGEDPGDDLADEMEDEMDGEPGLDTGDTASGDSTADEMTAVSGESTGPGAAGSDSDAELAASA